MELFRQSPTKEEFQRLQDLLPVVQLHGSGGWQSLCKEMDRLVAASLTSVEECMSADPKVTHAFHLRYVMRKSTVEALKDFVNNAAHEYAALMTQLSQPATGEEMDDGNPGDNTGTDDFQ